MSHDPAAFLGGAENGQVGQAWLGLFTSYESFLIMPRGGVAASGRNPMTDSRVITFCLFRQQSLSYPMKIPSCEYGGFGVHKELCNVSRPAHPPAHF